VRTYLAREIDHNVREWTHCWECARVVTPIPMTPPALLRGALPNR
jgi:hypothetical protein